VEQLLDMKDMPVPGRHNVANALAAACVGAQFDLSCTAIAGGLRTFRPLPHHLELVATIAGVSYYDDSVATTPESALVGLNSFDSPPIIILGGKDKGAKFDMLLTACIERCYGVICLGRIRDKLLQQLLNLRGPKCLPHVVGVDSLEQAVLSAASLAKPGQAVLLSPACSSYDMFTNYTYRGRRFAEAVRALPSAK
jgi:UDP-N-acetylmuramoylalanine--D-glutamate ligase